ncbi:MAG: metallophosphoesterase [Stappiaceae bacterium]
MMFKQYLFVLAMSFGFVNAQSVAVATEYQWVQLGEGSSQIIRSIEKAESCPELEIDGRIVEMDVRAVAEPDHPGFVCEKVVSRSVLNATLDGEVLPLLKPEVKRIVAVGDTGCRIRGSRVQACNNAEAWPLGEIVASIEQYKPDLVIHVGDYIYRSSACPPSGNCQGSPYGDRLATWISDWFGPARSLMAQVPIIFVRGNHETCNRNAVGWFRYMANGPVPADCPAVTAPWKTTIDGLDLITFDVAAGTSPRSDPAYLSTYRANAERVFEGLGDEAWFLTHRPLWAYLKAFGTTITGDETQKTAFGRVMPSAITLILSGHIHISQALDMADAPIQIIAGNSGTQLDPAPGDQEADISLSGDIAQGVYGEAGFGFLVLDRLDIRKWQIRAMDKGGNVRRRCVAQDRELSCGELIR